MMGTPIKVTAWLSAPLAGDPPHLDAICEWFMAQHAVSIERTLPGRGDETRHLEIQACPHRGLAAPRAGAIPIPIDRVRVSETCVVARCSSPIFRADYEYVERWAKRIDSNAILPLLGTEGPQSVDHRSGQTKAYFMPLRVRIVKQIVWFCVAHGDRKGKGGSARSPESSLRRIFGGIPAVGKKTAFGYGRVARWEMERVAQDWSWFAPSESGPVLMRPLPADLVPDGTAGARRSYGACCPPYWHPDRYGEICEPC